MREPLANIIAQTKAAQNNRQGSSRPLIDPHYATVSDDSDEMYAAIDEQDKVYTSGSETYAQIQPMTNESAAMPEQQQQQQPSQQQQSLNQTPLQSSCAPEDSSISAAPQPPSVDSLRHAAHAHSRQGKKKIKKKNCRYSCSNVSCCLFFKSFLVECHKFRCKSELAKAREASGEFAIATATTATTTSGGSTR